MKINARKVEKILLCLVLIFLCTVTKGICGDGGSCSAAKASQSEPLQSEPLQSASVYQDGTYVGKSSMVTVMVTIKDGAMSDIAITEHAGGGAEYQEMVEPLLDQMVQAQTTDVDTVSGATVSSDALKEAVRNALQKASEAE